MFLTLSKRFEFSSSRQVVNLANSDAENRRLYGPAVGGKYGHGINGVVYLVFNGPIDPVTGMMVNISTVKARVIELLSQRYDHKFLNVDTAPFDKIPPTAVNLARYILRDAIPFFTDLNAQPVVCYLEDTDRTAATAFADGRVEEHHWLEFSAARTTSSPNLSDNENDNLFGPAAARSGHGHNYRLRMTLGGECSPDQGVMAPYETVQNTIGSILGLIDHKNLNVDVPALNAYPKTTESLAHFLFTRLRETLPIVRVRLNELDTFFAEYDLTGTMSLGLINSFHAAHRLHSDEMSDQENLNTYGKCAHSSGHGHQYRVEATIGGQYDDRTGALYRLDRFTKALTDSIHPWSYKHLNLETDDFVGHPTTGENIVSRLWERLDPMLDHRLMRLRLWETANNRFTLRKN
jgi:6-pyruvoyltetrahydropterin/6-carboxytetrahydropterin synthase